MQALPRGFLMFLDFTNLKYIYKIFVISAAFQQTLFVYVIDFSDCETANLDRMVTSVVKLLRRNGLTAAVAGGCTGGRISAYLTSVVGVSETFRLHPM
ncbi:MAG: CinA family protein [Oscillospiraceae bacterium]|nr:CinA family protein [Oscillospiraceae bacterium]